MNAKNYDLELQQLRTTYEAAMQADISTLKDAITGASGSSLISVGSGGSYTIASLLSNLHESYTGRVSHASTPLEIICNPTLASSSPVFLISAEGKNPDIIEALHRAKRHSGRTLHVLTNRGISPLLESARTWSDITTHVYELARKDGYLATNSLLLDATLVARTYAELDGDGHAVPASLEDLRLESRSIADWLHLLTDFLDDTVRRGNLIIAYSPLLKPIATDLESKLSEAALLHCQVADLRSFAHGRHLWLAQREADCAILAIVDPMLHTLWTKMRELIPASVPVATLRLGAAKPGDLLAGLVAQMYFVSGIAHRLDKDPGKPEVPQFGIDLHYLALRDLIPSPEEIPDFGELSKSHALGARWPFVRRAGAIRRAGRTFVAAIQRQDFRAIVFDYDGTLSSSHRSDNAPSPEILAELRRLDAAGICLGIASGRGGSIQERLSECLDSATLSRMTIGLYNCGQLLPLHESSPPETSEFLSHVTRIVGRLQAAGAPIKEIKPTQPYQVSVRFHHGANVAETWYVIADAMRQAGLDVSRVFHSRHSVDVLAARVDKSHLVAHLIEHSKISPYQILTIGDQGAWPGNDSSLLEHRFSLSVDIPSRRLDRGWKLAPLHKTGAEATLWYLQRTKITGVGRFALNFSAPPSE